MSNNIVQVTEKPLDFITKVASQGIPTQTDLTKTSQAGSNKTILSDGTLTSEKILRALVDCFSDEYKNKKLTLSIQEYLDMVLEKPQLMLRPISRYVKDAMDYVDTIYGSKTVRRLGRDVREFSFLDLPWKPQELKSVERFIGHPVFWNKFYGRLDNFSKMACPNTAYFIHGPGSTGKSRAFDSLFETLEYYSNTDEGAMFTYEWVFDKNLSDMGFHSLLNSRQNLPVKQDEIILSIPANKNSMPIFLFDLDYRRELVDLLIKSEKLPEDFNRDFLLTFKLDEMSRKIRDGLLELYEGDGAKALRHLRIRRSYFSKNGGKGLVLKQPTSAPNTYLKPITPDINWDALPPQIVNVLSSAGLHSLEGALATANHGIYYCDDMFRGIEKHRGLNEFLYILRLAEKGDANVPDPSGINVLNETFDILQLGTVNDSRLGEVAELDPENWDAIRARLDGDPIEHERCYKYVAKLFKDKLDIMVPPETHRHVSPNVLNAFSLWVAMTHLFPHANPSYYDKLPLNDQSKKRIKQLLENMTLLNKALLYQNEDINSFVLDSRDFSYGAEDQKFLQDNTQFISEEYNLGFGEHNLEIYEGCVGLPSRVAERILAQAARYKPNESFTVIELFNVLEQACKRTFRFEMQRNQLVAKIKEDKVKAANGGNKNTTRDSEAFNIPQEFPPTKDLLDQVIKFTKRKIRYDVCQATGIWKSRDQIKDDLQRYFAHVKAYTQRDSVAPAYRMPIEKSEPNNEVLSLNESIFNPDLSESRKDDFRRELITKIGSWKLDLKNEGKDAMENIDSIFPDLASKLEAKYTKENKIFITNFVEDLKAYIEYGKNIGKIMLLQNDPKRKALFLVGIKGLEERGYNIESLTKEVQFAFKDYIS